MKTKCSCGRMVADEQLQECPNCGCLLCDMCGLGHNGDCAKSTGKDGDK